MAKRIGKLSGGATELTRRGLVSAEAKSSPTPSSPGQTSSRSLSLDQIRRTQIEAMEGRAARRVGELLGDEVDFVRGRQTSPEALMKSSKGFGDIGQNRTVKRDEEPRGAGSRTPPSYEAATRLSSAPSLGSSGLITGSSMKRNITQRRSRGRVSDDGSTAPKSSLLSRRPRSRSKDRRYSIDHQAPDTHLFSQYFDGTQEPVSPEETTDSTAWQDNGLIRQAHHAQQSLFSPRDRDILVQPPLEGGLVLGLAGQASAVRRESNVNLEAESKKGLSIPEMPVGSSHPNPSHFSKRMDSEVKRHETSHELLPSSVPQDGLSLAFMTDDASTFYEGFLQNASVPSRSTMDSSMQTSAPVYRSSFDKRPKADSEHLASDSGEESNE